MFIVSNHNYRVRRDNGSFYDIKKGFIGTIPNDIAQSSLVQRAIRGGGISVPQGKKDKHFEQAEAAAKKKAAKNDKRLETQNEESQEETETQE
ncbi:MAG TPA: hypothetical protein DDY31_17765 [Lachnospiraceae bacterium]|nr:hypothetical protein [Lachnospiraceae bacterium]